MSRLRPEDGEARKQNPLGKDFSEALARGLSVLSAFGPGKEAMTLSEAARAVDLPRGTVRRALLTLEYLGYMREEGRLFRLQPQVLRLAGAYLGADPVSTILQPGCERVAQVQGVACSAAVLDGTEIVMIAYASPRRPGLHAHEGIGMRLPAAITSLGRVLIGARPEEDWAAFLDVELAPSRTQATVMDAVDLRERIRAARDEEFALADQEAELGFRSISVPVRRRDGMIMAALNVGTRVEEASVEQMMETHLPFLRETAMQLREQLI